jgi:hypothetical protein
MTTTAATASGSVESSIRLVTPLKIESETRCCHQGLWTKRLWFRREPSIYLEHLAVRLAICRSHAVLGELLNCGLDFWDDPAKSCEAFSVASFSVWVERHS